MVSGGSSSLDEQDCRHRGRVLVIEDHPLLGEALVDSISQDHDVHLETTAADALHLFRGGRRFDLVLCDMSLPGMDGVDLHEELHRLDADCAHRMVFMTGGACGARAADFIRRTPNVVLQKPFAIEVLLSLIKLRLSA